MSNRGHLTNDNKDKFIRKYKQAVEDGEESFTFDGQEVLVSYAKYVVQYLNNTND